MSSLEGQLMPKIRPYPMGAAAAAPVAGEVTAWNRRS